MKSISETDIFEKPSYYRPRVGSYSIPDSMSTRSIKPKEVDLSVEEKKYAQAHPLANPINTSVKNKTISEDILGITAIDYFIKQKGIMKSISEVIDDANVQPKYVPSPGEGFKYQKYKRHQINPETGEVVAPPIVKHVAPVAPNYIKPDPAVVPGLDLKIPSTKMSDETSGASKASTLSDLTQKHILNPVRDAGNAAGNAVSSASKSVGDTIKDVTTAHPSVAETGAKVANAVSNTGQSVGKHIANAVAGNPALALGGVGAAALGGLGYLAYKKLKSKQKEKENIVNNQ
jgi:hypothetical protein